MTSVLYDVPGPKARRRYAIFNVIGIVIAAAGVWFIYRRFEHAHQWDADLWKPFLHAEIWQNFLLPGIEGTLKAFAAGMVLALLVGILLGTGRLSEKRLIRWPCAVLVELFRAVPLLILMLFLWLAQTYVLGLPEANLFAAVVIALTMYNGSVIAEILRAGVQALPRGQREAGLATGLTPGQTMRLILLPQAFRSMLPAIVAQGVVLLKDTALGYIIGYGELLRQSTLIGSTSLNVVPALLVVAAIYIAMNLTLGSLAHLIAKWTHRSGRAAVATDAALATTALPPAPTK